ncbi:MAG TPA: tRNA guanosine(34) transglycosylase Tgt [Gemmataceae bacterium]|jgi:queuine tRNA-ribosyltransferase|nr:tRNA guanosine(34) transglycosylase Tgt [Gemmataceae bacterium]
MKFNVFYTDGAARLGRLETPHGAVETPVFMPVGTRATVKGITPVQLAAAGATIILGNTYHLALRPGDEIIAEIGGLHRFMGWNGPILTDSGGFQIFSLGDLRQVNDDGVVFRSHVDGQILELTPARAMAIQENLGSDIAMCLDECPSSDAMPEKLIEAVRRSILWAHRCRQSHRRTDQALFAIVQGGLDMRLRQECAEAMAKLDFPGYALGGFSVGESPQQMLGLLPACADFLPAKKPRYLMGVGRPEDILAAVSAGIDMFDCVLPTRNGRNASAFTRTGQLRLRNARHRRDSAPLESDCDCYTCAHFSRAYLHHLFQVDEMLGPTLLSIHNVAFYMRLMREIRDAIRENRLAEYCLAATRSLVSRDAEASERSG